MPGLCSVCDKNVTNRGGANCNGECGAWYHFKCINLSTEEVNAAKAQLQSWHCPDCEMNSTIVELEKADSDDHDEDAGSEDKTSRAIQLLQKSVKSLLQEQRRLTAAVEKMAMKLDCFEKAFPKEAKKLQMLDEVIKERDEMKTEIVALTNKVDQVEQDHRDCNVEIKGIPVTPDEDVMTYVKNISNVAGCNISPSDISYVRRLQGPRPSPASPPSSSQRPDAAAAAADGAKPAPASQPPFIVVRFNNLAKRDEFLQKARQVRPLNTASIGISREGEPDPIYINEHLTKQRKILLSKVRQFAKDNGYKYVWLQNGTIRMRKMDKSRVYVINNYQDFLKITV